MSDPTTDNLHPYTHCSFDVTSLVGGGGTFELRFAEVNNQDNLYQGIDDVSLLETFAAIPEASTTASFGLLLALGLAGMARTVAKSKKAAAAA